MIAGFYVARNMRTLPICMLPGHLQVTYFKFKSSIYGSKLFCLFIGLLLADPGSKFRFQFFSNSTLTLCPILPTPVLGHKKKSTLSVNTKATQKQIFKFQSLNNCEMSKFGCILKSLGNIKFGYSLDHFRIDCF
jgi:hypothetical protein